MIDFGENTGIRAIVGFTDATKDLIESKSNPYNYPKMVELSPPEHLEKRLKEAREFKEKGDIQQSCEKLYLVVESIIKILAEKENVEAYQKAISGRGWNTYLLGEAVAELEEKYSKEPDKIGNLIGHIWDKALILHRYGFHDNYISKKAFLRSYEFITENLPIIAQKAGIKLKFNP
uniref:DUF86 domain-containing protein n=1 Tax=candidate division WOR-3 bacterium TaxID=2052148 RepID=A0A7C2K462_UNCW3